MLSRTGPPQSVKSVSPKKIVATSRHGPGGGLAFRGVGGAGTVSGVSGVVPGGFQSVSRGFDGKNGKDLWKKEQKMNPE